MLDGYVVHHFLLKQHQSTRHVEVGWSLHRHHGADVGVKSLHILSKIVVMIKDG